MPDNPQASWDVPPPHLLELIYETMSDGVAVFDTAGRVAYCNPAMCLLVGRPVQDIVGKAAAEAWGGPGSGLVGTASMTTVEERIRRPDGSEKVVTGKSFALSSNPPLQVHIYRDVTKIREARRALEDSYKVFHAFMANNPAMAMIKDPAGRYVYVNSPTERMLGRAADEWVGKTDEQLWPSDIAHRMRQEDDAVRKTGETLQFEETLPTIWGMRHFFTFKFIVADSAGQNLLASTSLDVTDLLEREEEIAHTGQVQEILLEIMATLSGSSTQDHRRVLVLLGAAIETTCATFAFRRKNGTLDIVQHHWSGGAEPGTRSQPRWDLAEDELASLLTSLSEGDVVAIEDLGEVPADQRDEIARLHTGNTTAFLAAPIRGENGSLAGFVAVDDHRQPRQWTETDSRALVTIARMMARHLPY